MTIVTPADAENVLCVGGIENDLKNYQHIEFSSYGPSADKRLKPNVVAFGNSAVARPSGGFTYASGTSFSSPLVAGFAACAWQTRRDLTALQMKSEIEKSADLYPYFDYAYGYGVPQAAYFTEDIKQPAERSFTLVQEKDGVKISIPKVIEDQAIFFNVEDANGVLLGYYKTFPETTGIKLANKDFGQGKKLNVSYNGFYDSCPITGTNDKISLKAFNHSLSGNDGTFKKVKREGWQGTYYFQFDYNLMTEKWNGFNHHFALGCRWMYGKTYKIGMGLGLDWNRFVSLDDNFLLHPFRDRTILRNMQVRGELMQRVVLHRLGLNWDLGVYGGVNISRRMKTVQYTEFHTDPQPFSNKTVTYYRGVRSMNLFEYGATTRLSYSIANMLNIGVYGRYRLSPFITKDDSYIGATIKDFSPWSVGIELEITP